VLQLKYKYHCPDYNHTLNNILKVISFTYILVQEFKNAISSKQYFVLIVEISERESVFFLITTPVPQIQTLNFQMELPWKR